MVTIKNQTALEHGKKLLSDAHGYEFLSDTWPERLGIDDIAVLQSGDIEGPDYLAWDVCLTKAGEVGELATQPQQWGVATDSPPEFWTGVAPTRHFIIPLCHEHLIDGAILWPVGLQLKYTISPLDFAEYLQKANEQPSKFIAGWFDAFGIEWPTDEQQTEAVVDTGNSANKKKRVKGETDRLRTEHFIDWVSQTNYKGNQTHYWLQDELRRAKPDLWGSNEQTFNKWLQTGEGIPAKKLLDRLKLEARQAV